MSRKASLIIIGLGLALVTTLFFRKSTQTLILDGERIELELAETPEEMMRGLSGRASLPDGHGMLFVYPEDTVPSFWMKNMHFPIDIIWLDRNWKVIGVEKNISPSTYPQTFSPQKPVRYVLEKNAN